MAYRKMTTAKKGFKEGAYALGGGAVVTVAMEVARSRGYLPWEKEQDAKIATALIGFVVFALKSLRNYVQEWRKRRRAERRDHGLDEFVG